jgi:hypothetical protein
MGIQVIPMGLIDYSSFFFNPVLYCPRNYDLSFGSVAKNLASLAKGLCGLGLRGVRQLVLLDHIVQIFGWLELAALGQVFLQPSDTA